MLSGEYSYLAQMCEANKTAAELDSAIYRKDVVNQTDIVSNELFHLDNVKCPN